MFKDDQYLLLDFGNGRKLECFGGVNVERPSPAADHIAPDNKSAFGDSSSLSFKRSVSPGKSDGTWSGPDAPEAWQVEFAERLRFHLQPSPFGHLGIFPEQADNWQWLMESAIGTTAEADVSGLKAINLFGYTGGSTMALAAAGVHVTHVDSAQNICRRARANAQLSGLGDHPVRWICDDVMTFLKREIKRASYYDIFVADPPAFGRGKGKQQWRIQQDLPLLLEAALELTQGQPQAILLSCHSPGYEAMELRRLLSKTFQLQAKAIDAGPMHLMSKDGRQLNAGHRARWKRS